MKRLHRHVRVPNVEQSIAFCSTMLNAAPVVVKDDYATWMLDDPFVNLAISSRARTTGVDHVGIQVGRADELGKITARLKEAGDATACGEDVIPNHTGTIASAAVAPKQACR